MKLLLKIGILLLLSFFSIAQSLQSDLDSLHRELQLAKNDTIRMEIYGRLGGKFDDVNLDSSVYYAEKVIKIANHLQLKFEEEMAKIFTCWPLSKLDNSINLKYTQF